MEAYHIDRFVSVDGIVRRSSGDPQPRPRDVLMRVRASSLNYRDLMVLKGGGRGPTKPGVVPLSDGAGEVTAIGDRVTRVKVGDRIIGYASPASSDRPDIPFRRGKGRLPPFRGPRPFRKGRDLARLNVRLRGRDQRSGICCKLGSCREGS
jgi:NADPH:quinone reductase-like Zn-dependent oxidoreductase